MNYEAIKEFCIKDKTKLETDDKMDACFEGYLYAIRTYSPKYGKFKEYSEYCMKTYIKKIKKQLQLQKQAEMYDFSLNRSITYNSNEKFGNVFFADPTEQFQSLEIKLCISDLDLISKQICCYLFKGYSKEEICSFLNITDDIFSIYKIKLQNHFSKI
ncbi:hypothetical protein [Huintestinicola sp.]|uniref:hypothetical protein n=1 Tax=Huintestinicola sp. TaxID=2981661 RepID=UPI003D7D28EB